MAGIKLLKEWKLQKVEKQNEILRRYPVHRVGVGHYLRPMDDDPKGDDVKSKLVKRKGKTYYQWKQPKSAEDGEWVTNDYAKKNPRRVMWMTCTRLKRT